ncbi:MAG: glycosyltransferase family 2 protein [Lachnospiraceae bacterium]|nr:glycosyltransferase family 2 protein [Lachnospiraceae bacterium]
MATRDLSVHRPLVSVIIPAYNCTGTICQAVDSALAQEEVPLEILVINDGSPDDLGAVMKQYQDRRQVRYVRNRHSLGTAAARNRGVKMAKGKYVAFLDADDWWAKDKLKKQLRLLEQEGAAADGELPVLCATARELANPDGELTGRIIPVHERISYRRLLLHNCINCSSVVMRTDVAKKFPMKCEESHEDYITWLKILKQYGYAVAVNEPLLKYRLSSSGKSGNKLHSARMTYHVYHYVGFGKAASICLFCVYAVNGVFKYARAFVGGRFRPHENA